MREANMYSQASDNKKKTEETHPAYIIPSLILTSFLKGKTPPGGRNSPLSFATKDPQLGHS